jgi:TolB protein
VVLGALGLLAVALFVVVSLTFRLDGLPGAGMFEDIAVLTAVLAPVAGLVTGFLGRRSPRRRTALLGSLLSVLAIAGFWMAAIQMPHDPYIADLAWTPDSTTISYTHTRGNYEEDGIWKVAADGSTAPAELVGDGTSASWSPDGTTIAFVRGGYGGDLWLMNADGSHPRKLTAGDAKDGVSAGLGAGPSWSPDGSQIVFSGFPRGDGSEGIWIIDADGTDLHQIVSGGNAPAWSPDGTRIAYLVQENNPQRQQSGYWLMAVDGTGRTELPGDNTGAPRWTSDGRITVDCPQGTCVMDSDGSNREVLLPDHTGAVLSPDGALVAYVTGTGIKSDLIVTTLDQTTGTSLTR